MLVTSSVLGLMSVSGLQCLSDLAVGSTFLYDLRIYLISTR